MSYIWAEIRVNGYGYRIKQDGHRLDVRRLEPGGISGGSRGHVEDLALLARLAEIAQPGEHWEEMPRL